MRCTTLIQNVSTQCIPNLVAIRTFQPRRVVWVHTPQMIGELQRLRKHSPPGIEHRTIRVPAREPERLHRLLREGMSKIPPDGTVIYNLTGGTKSMSLQGLLVLAGLAHAQQRQVYGVVMDPEAQEFDILFPEPANGKVRCATLSLSSILEVHGNTIHQPGRGLRFLRAHWRYFEALRGLAPQVVRELQGRKPSKNEHGWVSLTGGDAIPATVRKALRVIEDAMLVRALHIERNRVRVDGQRFAGDVFAYVCNTWMEDWVGATLARGLSDWQGGSAGVQVRFKATDRNACLDLQEFDFLGARHNQLVYWSCKRVKEVTSKMLFEIDALRDEMGGRDHHIAGLAYMGQCSKPIKAKAQRLGIRLVNVCSANAHEELLRQSHQ